MKSFIAVYYEWFMDTGYFSEEIIEAKDEKEADQIASSKAFKKARTFSHCDYYIVEGEKTIITHLTPRKLTFWERITGKVENP